MKGGSSEGSTLRFQGKFVRIVEGAEKTKEMEKYGALLAVFSNIENEHIIIKVLGDVVILSGICKMSP